MEDQRYNSVHSEPHHWVGLKYLLCFQESLVKTLQNTVCISLSQLQVEVTVFCVDMLISQMSNFFPPFVLWCAVSHI
jgi:ABC-type polysaccharide transport system permease subunit